MPNPLSALAVASSSSFLTGLEEPALRAILGRAKVRRISAKDNVVTSGQRATHLFLVQSGWVQYYHLTKEGDSVVLAWMGPGDVVGLTAMLNGPSTYMATAETTSDCELLVWERSVIRPLHFADLCPTPYWIGHQNRTGKAGRDSAQSRRQIRRGPSRRNRDPRHQRSTRSVSRCQPFTASRVLSSWEREGILSKGRGRVLLHSPEGLMLP